MTKPKSLTISGPMDVRHVGGVSVPGVTIPIFGIERPSIPVEPDTTPSHTFVAQGNIEVPRRSNTITTSLSRPSLKLKTSISLLRARSNSTTAKRDVNESSERSSQADMPAHSLKKKASTSRFWQKSHYESPAVERPREENIVSKDNTHPTSMQVDSPELRKKPSLSRLASIRTANPYTYQAPPPPLPKLVSKALPFLPASQKQPPTVRPKRADSGTAIEFDDLPIEERPLGFREIIAVPSFAERMSLYKKTRDYWAHTDHGLNEWVHKAGSKSNVPV